MEILRIKKGFIVSGFNSGLGVFITILGLSILALALLIPSFACLIFAILFLFLGIGLVASFSGVEVDYNTQKVRSYRTQFFYPHGEWEDLNQFDQIILNNNSFTTTQQNFIDEANITTHNAYFQILLYSNSTKKSIELAEEIDYTSARKRMIEITKQINHLPVRDVFQEKLAKSNSKRR